MNLLNNTFWIMRANPENIALMGQRSREIIEKEINIHSVLGNYMEAFRGAMSRSDER